jgi:hypothetical protein
MQVLQRRVTVSQRVSQGEWQVLGESIVPQRVFTLQEIELLARLVGMHVVGYYGAWDLEVGLEHKDAYRTVAVLSKHAQ